jgi:branched-chain amino acid transport system permease protein
MEVFIQQIINGLAMGSIYALVSIGYTMVYGILFFVNFPHGEILMVGTYIALLLVIADVPFLIVIGISLAATALCAAVVEKLAYSRLRYERRLAPLLSAMGVSIVIQNAVMLILGPQMRLFPSPSFFEQSIEVLGVRFSNVLIFVFAISVILMVALEIFLKRHYLGIGIRAASEDLVGAKLMGVEINKAISLTFAIGGALAAAGGIMLAIRYGPVYPRMGFGMMLKAFAACVLGGIGNIYGAVIGSFIIGLAESLGAAYISSGYQDAIAFAVLVVTLLFRPAGILGGRTEAKV